MITKIEKIKNLGIFSDYKWDSNLPEFKRFNLIYRWNGYGKTTLSQLFDSLEATRTLEEYIIKGFVLADERLKQGNQVFGKDYFNKISINSNQIRTLEKLRRTLLPKLISGQIRINNLENFDVVIN